MAFVHIGDVSCRHTELAQDVFVENPLRRLPLFFLREQIFHVVVGQVQPTVARHVQHRAEKRFNFGVLVPVMSFLECFSVRLDQETIKRLAVTHAFAGNKTRVASGANNRRGKSRDCASTVGALWNILPSVVVSSVRRRMLCVHACQGAASGRQRASTPRRTLRRRRRRRVCFRPSRALTRGIRPRRPCRLLVRFAGGVILILDEQRPRRVQPPQHLWQRERIRGKRRRRRRCPASLPSSTTRRPGIILILDDYAHAPVVHAIPDHRLRRTRAAK
mmetsp:Transcript_1935/g.6260  ORF Transcript_1935/g.6260 Transcript_1935/m.6260 type:complete len:275 (-) Transcript_1935:206-1030(-)